MIGRPKLVSSLLLKHFRVRSLDHLAITRRSFPARIRPDLQRFLDSGQLFDGAVVERFIGLPEPAIYDSPDFSTLVTATHAGPVCPCPAQYDEVDIGEDAPVRCLKTGLWLLRHDRSPMVMLMSPQSHPCKPPEISFHIAAVHAGDDVATPFFRRLEKAVADAPSYRGKVLSLEQAPEYSGASAAIKVHRLARVERDQVILPGNTIALLERNVIDFVRQRPRLAEFRLPSKKGVLFYGPPGTGKTHTVRYLAGNMEGHTTLLVSGEQVALIDEYMAIARLLQPSILVIEDADLIARCRDEMRTSCEEVLLNKLLNEMDGLREDAEILFVLTTNRPEALEAALTARPGRIDQAIEFPLPDADGRAKLARLYARGVQLPDEVVAHVVKRTNRVSASFIKELMRRAMQFHLEHSDSPDLATRDIDDALEELLFAGGTLNRKLLGMQEGDSAA